jgi:trehalose 6-phosphate synthase
MADDLLGLEVDLERRRVLHGGRVTLVREYPSAIDVAELRRRAEAPEARRWLGRLAGRGKSLVVRADRIEPAKNVARGFDAFRRLLERRPDLAGRVLFVASIYPSREWMSEYRAYAASVREACRRLEEAFPGSLELYTKDDYARSLALLRLYDVLLVNSTMDGLNVVPKEGAALNERSGAIVLSTTTGVYEELREAVVPIEDAFDVDGTAEALEQALLLPEEERRRRAEQARRVAERLAPAAWLEEQVRALRIDPKPWQYKFKS